MGDSIWVIYEWSKNTKIKRIKEENGAEYAAINSIFKIIREQTKKKNVIRLEALKTVWLK